MVKLLIYLSSILTFQLKVAEEDEVVGGGISSGTIKILVKSQNLTNGLSPIDSI